MTLRGAWSTMILSIGLIAALALFGCTEISVESPGCTASASAGGGGGGNAGTDDHASEGASGGGANSSAGCTPGKTTVTETIGSGRLPTQ
jgi:hypothetical protein